METGMVRDATAMASNSALNRAIVAIVPIHERDEFEQWMRRYMFTRIHQMYKTWKANRMMQKV